MASDTISVGQKQASVPFLLAGQLLLCAALVLPLTIQRAPSADVWWHLAIGRLIWQTHRIPRTDPYSFTAAGHAWQNDEWLFSVIIYALWQWHRLHAVYLLKSVVLLSAAMVAAAHASLRSRAHPLVVAVATVVPLALCGYQYFWDARPQIVGYGMVAALLALIWAYVETGHTRLLWAFPPLAVLWGNLHASVLLGPALLLVAAFGCRLSADRERAAPLALAAAATLLVVPLNGVGTDLLTYPFRIWHTLWRDHLNEWQSPIQAGHWGNVVFVAVTLAAMALCRRHLRGWELLTTAAVGALAVTGWRHVPLFGFVSIPVWAVVLGARTERWPRGSLIFWRLVGAVAVAFIAVRLSLPDVGRQPMEDRLFPRWACDFLTVNRLPAHLFNPYGWGGYLIWRLWPAYQVFIDGRAVQTYPAETYQEYFDAAFKPRQTDAILQRYGVDTVICFRDADFAEASSRLFKGRPQWRLVYEDDLADVFVRADVSLPALVYPPSPYRYRAAVHQALVSGRLAEARTMAALALQLDPEDPQSALSMGVVAFRSGDAAAGERWTRRALDEDPHLVEAWLNLAIAAATRGDLATARRDAGEARRLAPDDVNVNRLLRQLEAQR